MIVLGIETSCDETAAAVVRDDKAILSHVIHSQVKEHADYGGVVPEIAARSHVEQIDGIVARVLEEAKVGLADLDAIAVTAGPGLIGGVIVGVMYARGLAAASGKPLIAVNHLEGHALSARLAFDIPFPFLLLLVSGGHCQFLAAEGVGRYRKLGGTLDDALGEAYDKVAKMLGLGYPGGPAVEARALRGDRRRFSFPRALVGREGCDFSFSGIKTAVRQTIQSLPSRSEQDVADLCASFEQCVADVVADRARNAMAMFQREYGKHSSGQQAACTALSAPPLREQQASAMGIEKNGQSAALVIAGGVAANAFLRGTLEEAAKAHAMPLLAPPLALCTDNGAMIAWAGVERFRLGLADIPDFEPKARWPLG